MKKLMTLAIGLGLVLGLSTATFAQEKPTTSKKAKTTKAKSTKAPKTKSTSKM